MRANRQLQAARRRIKNKNNGIETDKKDGENIEIERLKTGVVGPVTNSPERQEREAVKVNGRERV